MNKTNKKIDKAPDFQEYLQAHLKDKEFKKLYDEYGRQLEIAYQINGLRRKAKLTQAQMAKKIGTTQSNIARIETGEQNFTIALLNKIAKALNKELKVSFG